MLLHVIARGKIGRSPEAELVERYAKRITWPLRLTELPETGGRIPEPLTPFRTILLDERGDSSSSEDLAEVWLGMRVRTTGDRSLVYDVHPLGPAARAGVKEGDQIVTVQVKIPEKLTAEQQALFREFTEKSGLKT